MISRSSVGRFSATLASNCWNLAFSSFSSFCEAGCGFVAMFNYSLSRFAGVSAAGARRRNPEQSEGSVREALRRRERGKAERELPAEILSKALEGAKSKDLLLS
jgi:hypothetical protein